MYCIVMIYMISYYLFSIILSQPIHICSNGCSLLFDEHLECVSNEAFVPNGYINDIDIILRDSLYECFYPNNRLITNDEQNTNSESAATIFDLDSYVLIWQAIIIAIIVPLMSLLLFKVMVILCNKTCETLHCKENTKCRCFLYCFSSQYRQRSRNRKFHNEIYNNDNNRDNNNNNNNNNGWKWNFGRKNKQNVAEIDNAAPIFVGDPANLNGEDGIDLVLEDDNNNNRKNNDYQHVPLNDNDNQKENVLPNVLEEVSVENSEMEKYLQAPGGNHQDIELSFSSQGLRQISYREVV